MQSTGLFDRRATFGGALTALITAGMGLILAFGLGALFDWNKGAKTLVASLFAAVGFVLGGFRAGLLHPPGPFTNGAAAGAVAYLPLGILQRVISHKSLSIALVLSAMLAASFGMFGGVVANTSNRYRHPNG